MARMFGFGGAPCPRCEHKNSAAAQYCAQCGLTLGAPRNAPVLRENRWIAGPDELAVFFGVRELSGLFVKTLRVPATTRAYILQGDQATEVPQGEYEIEGFFTRLNHLLRNQHAEILITRMAPLAVTFNLTDLPSAEHLSLSAQLVVSVRIEQVSAFARHFMTMPGSVTSAHLSELLTPSVRQIAAEFTAAQSLRDMAANAVLREQFDERLQGALALRLAQYGLAAVQVDALTLRHDKFDANRARIGSLWLLADEGHVELEHSKQLDQLYNDQEWQAIWREEQQQRLNMRREELRQDAGIEQAGVTLQNAERMHALRAREIDLYGRIAESKSRKEALQRGAGELVAELEHELAKKGAARRDEAGEWEHLRQLAQIHMRTEMEIAQQNALEQRQLAQQRFAHQLLQQQIQNKIGQALSIEDESRKRAELARLHQNAQDAARRQAEIDAEEHTAQWQGLALANAARKREAERIAEWEDAQALARRRTMERGSADADAVSQHEKLLRTIEADGVYSRQGLSIELEGEEKRHQLRQQQQEAQWQQELRKMEHEREEKFALLAHAADLARIEIARNESIGAMSDTAKLALAAAPNAAALGDYLKTQVHASMSGQQLAALSGVVAATNSTTPAEAARSAQAQVEHEQQRRDAEVDKDRRHQLDLLALQNDVNKAALAAASGSAAPQSAVHHQNAVHHHYSVGARMCTNGHLAGPDDRFCAVCGTALPPRPA